MRVLVVEEHPERERLALLLLKGELESRGHQVVFTDTWRLERALPRVDPDVVVDNVSDSVAHFAGKWTGLSPRQRNVNLVWEQFVNPVNQFRFRFDETLSAKLVDGRVAWGEAFREALLMENPAMAPSRVRVCGSIKHAAQAGLSRVPADALLERLDSRLRARAKRVLFVDSFPAAMRDPALDRAMRGERPLPYLYEAIHYLKDLREPAIALLAHLAASNPDVLFVARLHPTKIPDYQRHFDDLERVPNVVVESEGDIGPLIRVSDLVLAARSGSLVEAHVANVPAVNLSLDDHPFRRIGVVDTVEERFAPSVSLDRRPFPTLDALEERAHAFRVDADLAARWTHDPSPRTFARVADFLEETLEREALPRDLSPRAKMSRRVVSRRARLALRRLGLGRTPARKASPFDFDGVAGLIAAHTGAPPSRVAP